MTPATAANFMRVVSASFFGAALIFASGAFPGFDAASIWMHDMLDFPIDGDMGPYSREARWFSAIGGGVFASLCVLFYLVVAPAVERQDKAVINAAILSILIWFVIDSAGSIAAGVVANAAFNISFLAAFLAPLTLVRPSAREATG